MTMPDRASGFLVAHRPRVHPPVKNRAAPILAGQFFGACAVRLGKRRARPVEGLPQLKSKKPSAQLGGGSRCSPFVIGGPAGFPSSLRRKGYGNGGRCASHAKAFDETESNAHSRAMGMRCLAREWWSYETP